MHFSSMHVMCPAHLTLLPFDHPNSIWQEIQVTKSLIMHISGHKNNKISLCGVTNVHDTHIHSFLYPYLQNMATAYSTTHIVNET